MRSVILVCTAIASAFCAKGQFAPQAGISGSTAIYFTSPDIIAWASGCTVQLGLKDIALPDSGFVSSGNSTLAVGAADNFTVSLGDSGIAILTFTTPIANGSGPDFLIFENGFSEPSNNELAFLELAFVEVSSNGVDYHRFPAISSTQADTQIAGAGMYMNARNIHNLAGKYISKWGVPFDLSELSHITSLDISNITHIRLVDVIGSIGDRGSLDADGHKINDPYPTRYPIGGFDLDAVGVIHQSSSSSVAGATHLLSFNLFPNPASDHINIHSSLDHSFRQVSVKDLTGRVLLAQPYIKNGSIQVSSLPTGFYLLTISNINGQSCSAPFLKS